MTVIKRRSPYRALSARSLFVILLFLICVTGVSPAIATHGISIDGKLKYPADFSHFDYTSEAAKKGGQLNLHGLGGFDKMNPFTMKGEEPDGLMSLVFETLTASSLDEPFASYGLIAEDIVLADDHLSVTFTLNPKAKFSDGTPITSEDVKFSFETLMSDKANPRFQFYYKDIKNVEVLSDHQVRFNFTQKNRELHMIAAQLPVMSKKFYTEHPFGDSSLIPPVGSGPYMVADFKPGKDITYKRNPDYWAKNLPCRKNMFNYDTITYKYYKDQGVSLEAFKANEFDFMLVNVAKQWATDLDGDKFVSGRIIKEELHHKNNQGMQGFIVNIRRPLFQDVRVRKALALAFDFEWTNQALFHGQYTRSNSFFSNSPLAATGLPQGTELDLLNPFRDKLPVEVFTTPLTPFSTNPPASLRNNQREAKTLLNEAGWQVKDGVLKNQSGQVFEFEILLYSPFFMRVMEPYTNNLAKLGIKANIRKVDVALYIDRTKNFEFDMMVNVYGQSQSPGNEQIDYWHSSSAARPGSANLIGIKNEVIDALVEKLIYATTQDELTVACHALDRVLWYGYYLVPNWYIDYHRVTYWNKFGRPEKLPTYYSSQDALLTWWIKENEK